MRIGDVVWDVGVGDEGNVGRLVWDGSYLIVSFALVNLFCAWFDIGFGGLGSGLQVFPGRRLAKVYADFGIPSVILSQSHTYGADFV